MSTESEGGLSAEDERTVSGLRRMVDHGFHPNEDAFSALFAIIDRLTDRVAGLEGLLRGVRMVASTWCRHSTGCLGEGRCGCGYDDFFARIDAALSDPSRPTSPETVEGEPR